MQWSSAEKPSPLNSILSRKHRAWIALYALDGTFQARDEVLHLNNVTEADLLEFEESWLRMRFRNQELAHVCA
ncbi:hypothetical protein [Hymenobacter sp. BT491]|uniref:hypothetical protein n=1 Tax=Hymenobacter sp. BT491 TaxID=2766779 RepID=UPI001653D252|nr:hypothetical protein [Hymenobacter sp. BT491]MBC6989845.1 hypothetical protein [Hymenobacter sp. BT491]